jgi:hypothetical protein
MLTIPNLRGTEQIKKYIFPPLILTLCRLVYALYFTWGPSWPWSYDSWIYNYQCSQCLSPLMLWVRISIRARCTTLWDKVCQWLAAGRWFSLCPPVSSTNKTDRHDITEILMKVALNTIKQTIYSTWDLRSMLVNQ